MDMTGSLLYGNSPLRGCQNVCITLIVAPQMQLVVQFMIVHINNHYCSLFFTSHNNYMYVRIREECYCGNSSPPPLPNSNLHPC